MSKHTHTRTHTIWMDEGESIIYSVVLPDARISGEDAQEAHNVRERLRSGRKVGLFLDIRNVQVIDFEARKAIEENFSRDSYEAVALLVDSPVSRMYGASVFGYNQPEAEFRLFDDEVEALAWLKKVKPLNLAKFEVA